MKRISCFVLILALLCGCASMPALAAEDLADVYCQELGFATKAPANLATSSSEGEGLRISVGTPGYVPYVLVYRRDLGKKFSNPINYLNNVYREYMEDKYGSDMIGTNPCREYEIGGKKLLGAQYKYKASGNTLCLLRLIEVRDDGDVEYSAKFLEGKGEETLAVLETAVQYYRTDLSAQPEGEADGLTDVTCAEKGFSTKIPEDAQAGWEQADGIFYIWLGDYGFVPNVYIVRREKKLNDPENYVHNVYTNYMKETYGDRLVGTSLYEYYEIGGKSLYASSYMYKGSSGATINQVFLVEVRDDGDVEYCARFLNDERDATLKALDAAVRYYHTNDAGNSGKTDGLQLNAAAAQPIVSKTAEYKDGRFHITLPVGWQIMTQSEYDTFCFKSWDPSNPDRTVFLFMKLEPFLKSDAAKAWYKDKSGGRLDNIYSLTAEAPVMQSCTLQGFLDAIPDTRTFCETFYDIGYTIHPNVLPEMTNVQIIERTPSTLIAPPDCKENIIARIVYQDYLGQACEGLVTAQPRDSMQYIWDGVDTWLYTVSLFMGVTAPVGELLELEPVLVDCLNTFAFEQSYVNQAIQVSNETKEQLQAQMKQMEAAHDAMMSAWYAREESHDIAFQKLSDSIMGYDRLYDSSTGEVYLADVGFYDTYDLHRYEYNNSNLQLVDSSSQQYYLQGADYYITK